MKKSNSRTSHKYGSGDEGDDRRDDEQPTTSRGDTLSPEQISHNMNDLKAIDFNSADEVRQAMKAVLAGKMPPQSFTEEANHIQSTLKAQNNTEPVKINDLILNKPLIGHEVRKTVQQQVQQNLYKKMKTVTRGWTGKPNGFGTSTPGQKRPGRPPKAGPSKSIKKPKLSSMYLGKLSNVVPFRRGYESDAESDVESVVIYY